MRPCLLVEHVDRPDLGLGVVRDLPQGDRGDLLDLGLGSQLLSEAVQRLGVLFLPFGRLQQALQFGLLALELSVLLRHLITGRL